MFRGYFGGSCARFFETKYSPSPPTLQVRLKGLEFSGFGVAGFIGLGATRPPPLPPRLQRRRLLLPLLLLPLYCTRLVLQEFQGLTSYQSLEVWGRRSQSSTPALK